MTVALVFLVCMIAIAARTLPLMATSPFGALVRLPGTAQTALGLAIAAWTVAMVPQADRIPVGLTWGGLFLALLANAALGLAFALAAEFFYAVFTLGGAWLDMSLGFTFTAVFAPAGQPATLLERVLGLFGTTLFLTLGGLTDLVASIAASAARLTPFGIRLTFAAGASILTGLGTVFETAVTTALTAILPIVLAVIVVNVVIGVLGRLVPQLNLLAVDFPVLMAAGLALFALSLPVWLTVGQTMLGDLGNAISSIVQVVGTG